jgi:hypothetical protein
MTKNPGTIQLVNSYIQNLTIKNSITGDPKLLGN